MKPTIPVLRRNQESWMDREVAYRRERDKVVEANLRYGQEEDFRLGAFVGILIGLSLGFMAGRFTRVS